MKKLSLLAACLSLGCLNLSAAETPDAGTPVSRAEYNKLKAELKAEFEAELKAQREQFKKELSAVRSQMGKPSGSNSALLTKDGWAVSSENGAGKESPVSPGFSLPVVTTPGTSKLTLTGGASATLNAYNWDTASGRYFTALFNPIFLWEVNDRMRFEGDLDFVTARGYSTVLDVQTAELSYDVCDYLTFGAGRFANPSNYFLTNLRKDWVNKLPTAPSSALSDFVDGANIHGEVPIGSTLLTYAAFAGQSRTSKYPFQDLPWGGWTPDFSNVKTDLEFGGHLGFQPIEGLEIGYGLDTYRYKGDLDYDEFWVTSETITDWWGSYEIPVFHSRHRHSDVSVRPVMHTVDLNYFKDLNPLKGTVDFHAQWTWRDLDVSEVPDQYRGEVLGSLQRNNGGYLQLAYRPTHAGCFLADFEPVVRWEHQNYPGSHSDFWTFGLDYWLTDRTLLKAAYQVRDYSGGGDDDLWVFQFATGF